jgi:hypothetical protein
MALLVAWVTVFSHALRITPRQAHQHPALRMASDVRLWRKAGIC